MSTVYDVSPNYKGSRDKFIFLGNGSMERNIVDHLLSS